jgi:hypothetical protein
MLGEQEWQTTLPVSIEQTITGVHLSWFTLLALLKPLAGSNVTVSQHSLGADLLAPHSSVALLCSYGTPSRFITKFTGGYQNSCLR